MKATAYLDVESVLRQRVTIVIVHVTPTLLLTPMFFETIKEDCALVNRVKW